MIVVDTSVAVKWFLPEESKDRAEALLQKTDLAAPDLMLYEISNIFTLKSSLSFENIQKSINLLYKFQIQFFLLPQGGFHRVAEICRKFNITAYDASFVVLAETLNADFVTADKKLIQKVKSFPFVHLL